MLDCNIHILALLQDLHPVENTICKKDNWRRWTHDKWKCGKKWCGCISTSVHWVIMKQKFSNISFIEGITENLNEYINPKLRNLIVIDDLMSETGSDKRITKLFTKGSLHRNLSVISLLQNLFYNGKESWDISLNVHYIVLFKNPQDNKIITSLAKTNVSW